MGLFHARSGFARSTIPEEKWVTTRSLSPGALSYLPWLPEAFHAQRPKTCRPAADEAPRRASKKPLVPRLSLIWPV